MGRGPTSGLRGVNMQRVSRIAGGIGLAAAALVVMMVGWSRMNQPVRAPSVQPAEGRVMGDLTGFVGRVDQKARTVEVAEKLGLRPITMTVTDDTAITVRGEPRGLRDLKKDLPIRAFYEVRNDVTYLTKIQVVTDETQAQKARPAEAKPMTLPPVAAAPSPAVSSTKQSATFRPSPGLFVRRDVDTVDLVVGHVALEPLDFRPHGLEDSARFLRNRVEFLPGQLSRARDLALDHELRH